MITTLSFYARRLLAACLTLLFVGFGASARAQSLGPEELLPELRKGGYVLFVRHLYTNEDQADLDPWHPENIKAQRQLTQEGREAARALGAALRALHVPVEKVLTSKFWRAIETGKLLGVAEVGSSLDLTEGGLVVSPKENKRRASALKKLLGTPPATGKNVIIVSHRPNLVDAAGKELGDVGEGEVVVFQPQPDGSFKLVARVSPPERWTKWAKAEQACTQNDAGASAP